MCEKARVELQDYEDGKWDLAMEVVCERFSKREDENKW